MMRQRALRLGFLGLLLCSTLQAATTAKACPEPFASRGNEFEIGFVYQSLIPSGLPDINSPVVVLGAVLGVPVLGGTIQLQGGTGQQSPLSLYLLETTYRLELPTPYFSTFVLAGAHFLYYAIEAGALRRNLGATVGLGVSLMMGRDFELSFTLRTYIQQRSTIGFAGGFSFLL